MRTDLKQDIEQYVASQRNRVVEIARDLIRIPSENRAPRGYEGECQQYVAEALRRLGLEPVLYRPDEAPGIAAHPLYWPGRNYENRPNVVAQRKGSGGGRSLVLSGHIDTVPVGAQEWTRDPFGGEIDGNRLYGRGSNDMKGGVATNLFVMEALAELGLELAGDLTFETVVDEEFGGVNGTLAGRLMGFTADAAVISEPSFLRICPAQRGGRTAHITFLSPNQGILGGSAGAGVVEQLRVFLEAVADFARSRRERAPVHPMYAHLDNPVPVTVTRVHTAAWGTSEPTNTPGVCRVELFWQAMPGEKLADIDAEFHSWFDTLVTERSDIFGSRPSVVFPIRWLAGSSLPADEPIVTEIAASVKAALGSEPPIQGIEGPCDMYVFHEFGVPAVLWGARGGNTHNPDEYVEIDSLQEAARALLVFVCGWCGVKQ